MKKLVHWQIIGTIFILFFNGCDAGCRNLKVPEILFSLSTEIDKNILYLEDHLQSKVQLTIEPQSKAAQKTSYHIVSWRLPSGMQGQLLDANLEPIQEHSKLLNGDNTLYYNPLNVGEHILTLEIGDQYDVLKKEVVLEAFTVKEKRQFPFTLKLQADSRILFSHQEVTLSSILFSKAKEAASLIYTVKDIEVTNGSLFLAATGEQVQAGTRLLFGKQDIIFKPSAVVGTANIKITLSSNKGNDSSASLVLEVKPVKFSVNALLKEAQAEDKKRLKEDVALLEILLSWVDPLLANEAWTLVDWKCSDGVIRDIVNAEGEQLRAFPLTSTQRNKLYVKLNDLQVEVSPMITLTIEGPAKIIREVTLPLSTVFKTVVEDKIQDLLTATQKRNEQVQTYLQIPSTASNYQAIKEARKEAEAQIVKLKEAVASIQNKYVTQAGAISPIAKKNLKKAHKNIDSLEKKKAKLDKLKKGSRKERAAFEAVLRVASKSIFNHQNALISLNLSAISQAASKRSYRVKEIEVTSGTLVFESNNEVVKEDDGLIFGDQNLIFKPTGEIGQAIIKITVASDKEVKSTSKLVLDVKAVSFQAELQAEVKNVFSHQTAEIDLVISSNQKEAAELVYTVKDIEGTLFLKSTREKVEAGTKLAYGKQTLLFKSPIDPKAISEYRALLEKKKTLSITQGEASKNSVQPATSREEELQLVTQMDNLKLIIQSSKELTVKPLGDIQANLKVTVASEKGNESSSSMVLDMKPVSFQIGASIRKPLEEEEKLMPGDFAVLDVTLEGVDPSLTQEAWSIVSWHFSDKIDRKSVV